MICFKCNHEESEDFSFCPECGFRQTCQCGKKRKPNNKFCMGCGSRVDISSSPTITQPTVAKPLPVASDKILYSAPMPKKIAPATSNDNIRLKRMFNMITTPLFFLTFLLLLIALFAPLYSFTVFDGWVFYEANMSIITYIFVGRRYGFDMFDSFFFFRGGTYIVTTIMVITLIIMGTIKGIKSFKDGNEKIGEYAVTATFLMLIPFFFTRMLQTNVNVNGVSSYFINQRIFLLIAIIIAFISIFTRITLNLILNRKKFGGVHFASYIMNLSALVIIFFSLFVLFGRVFDFYVVLNVTFFFGSGGIFGVMMELRQLYSMTGSWIYYDVFRSLVFSAIISIIVLVAIIEIIRFMFTRAIRLTTTRNSKDIIFISSIMGLVIILWIFNANGTHAASIWSGAGPGEFQGSAETLLNNSLIIGFLLVLLSLIISIVSSIIFIVNKGKILAHTYNNSINFDVVESHYSNTIENIEDTTQVTHVQTIKERQPKIKLTINKISVIFALVSAGLIFMTFLVTIIALFSLSWTMLTIVGLTFIITILVSIAALVLHIVGLVQSSKHNINILGHILGIVGTGLYLLGGLMSLSPFLAVIGVIFWLVALVFMILAGIFVLTAKAKVVNHQ